MTNPRVLIVEDDPAIRAGVVGALASEGYETIEAGDGAVGLERALEPATDLVLLDIMLPEIDGFHVLESVRAQRPRLPVICLTAMGEPADRVRGLRAGADDYIVKPFGVDELLARVAAVLRRAPAVAQSQPSGSAVLEIAGRRIDLARQEVSLGSDPARVLPQREAEVLGYLAGNRGRAVSREELLERVWGIDPRGMQTRSVDMAVARLREQLGDSGPTHEVIITVRGRGYMLAGPS